MPSRSSTVARAGDSSSRTCGSVRIPSVPRVAPARAAGARSVRSRIGSPGPRSGVPSPSGSTQASAASTVAGPADARPRGPPPRSRRRAPPPPQRPTATRTSRRHGPRRSPSTGASRRTVRATHAAATRPSTGRAQATSAAAPHGATAPGRRSRRPGGRRAARARAARGPRASDRGRDSDGQRRAGQHRVTVPAPGARGAQQRDRLAPLAGDRARAPGRARRGTRARRRRRPRAAASPSVPRNAPLRVVAPPTAVGVRAQVGQPRGDRARVARRAQAHDDLRRPRRAGRQQPRGAHVGHAALVVERAHRADDAEARLAAPELRRPGWRPGRTPSACARPTPTSASSSARTSAPVGQRRVLELGVVAGEGDELHRLAQREGVRTAGTQRGDAAATPGQARTAATRSAGSLAVSA